MYKESPIRMGLQTLFISFMMDIAFHKPIDSYMFIKAILLSAITAGMFYLINLYIDYSERKKQKK